MLENRVGLTLYQASIIISNYPQLTQLLKKINDDLVFRKLKWGLKNFLKNTDGGQFSETAVCHYVGMTALTKYTDFLRSHIAQNKIVTSQNNN